MPNYAEFKNLFEINKPIIGMIHLAGIDRNEKVARALEELAIYEKEGVNGAIIEDYHGGIGDVSKTLKQSQGKFNLVLGVNILRNPYLGFELAYNYGARFVQFDSVQTQDLDLKLYNQNRKEFDNIFVLGGIRFKYIPQTGNSLEKDLKQGKFRCEAIVTTGQGTGIETPINKLKKFKGLLKTFPLIVGAGVNVGNVCEQLNVVDGAIIGSYFKHENNTLLQVNKIRVRKLIELARKVREKN